MDNTTHMKNQTRSKVVIFDRKMVIDFTISFSHAPEQVSGHIEYNGSLFRPESSDRFSQHFINVVRSELEDNYRPIYNKQIYILDHRHHPVPLGQLGELYIGLDRGYLQRPEMTAERLIPNPFTGRNHSIRGSRS